VYFGVLPCILAFTVYFGGLPCILTFYRVFWRFTVYFGVSTAGHTKNATTDASKTPPVETPKYTEKPQNTCKIHGQKNRFSFDKIVAVAAATIKYTENTR